MRNTDSRKLKGVDLYRAFQSGRIARVGQLFVRDGKVIICNVGKYPRRRSALFR